MPTDSHVNGASGRPTHLNTALTQGGLGYIPNTRLKFKSLCLDSLEQHLSEADQLPMSTAYRTEMNRWHVSVQDSKKAAVTRMSR